MADAFRDEDRGCGQDAAVWVATSLMGKGSDRWHVTTGHQGTSQRFSAGEVVWSSLSFKSPPAAYVRKIPKRSMQKGSQSHCPEEPGPNPPGNNGRTW